MNRPCTKYLFNPSGARFLMALTLHELRCAGKTTVTEIEAFYPFAPGDVCAIHYYLVGVGEGVWFRLYDGRVFDAMAQPAETGRDCYDALIH